MGPSMLYVVNWLDGSPFPTVPEHLHNSLLEYIMLANNPIRIFIVF